MRCGLISLTRLIQTESILRAYGISGRPITGRSHQIRVHLQYLGHPIANDPIYNNKIAWGKGNAKGGLWRELDRPYTLPNPPSIAVGKEMKESSTFAQVLKERLAPLNTSTGKTEKAERRKKEGKERDIPKVGSRGSTSLYVEDTLGGGSEATLSPAAVTAILHLRKVRDSEDNFARYRDMDRPPLPGPKHVQAGGTASGNGKISQTNSVSARKGLRMMSKQERSNLSEQYADSYHEGEEKSNPLWYVGRDEKGEYCISCGIPLLPDPTKEMLQIWLHAIRYRRSLISFVNQTARQPILIQESTDTDEWDYASPLPDWAKYDWQLPMSEVSGHMSLSGESIPGISKSVTPG